MAKLTAKGQRLHLLPAISALPGGRYPVEDKAHARAASPRVSANGSPAEKAKVRAKVSEKYPGIKQTSAGREIERRLSTRDKKW